MFTMMLELVSVNEENLDKVKIIQKPYDTKWWNIFSSFEIF